MDLDHTEVPSDFDILYLAAEKLKNIAQEYPAKWQKEMIDASVTLDRLAAFVENESDASETQPCLQVSQPLSAAQAPLGQCPTQGARVVAFGAPDVAPLSLSKDPHNLAEPSQKTGSNR